MAKLHGEREVTGALGYCKTDSKVPHSQKLRYHCGVLRTVNCTSGHKLNFDLSLPLGGPVLWLFF